MKKNNRLRFRVAIFALLAWTQIAAAFLAAQEIKFKHLTLADGLSQSTINCMIQDHRGFMWFGTQDGLNLYDGHKFTIYRHDPSDSASISSGYIECLLDDQAGGLWIGTQNGGLNHFDFKTKKFDRYLNHAGDSSSLSLNDVRSICYDHSGRLWVGTQGGGLNFFSPENNTFKRFQHDPKNPSSLSNNNVITMDQDTGGYLWVGTYGGGLNHFDTRTMVFTHYQNDPQNSSSLSNNSILSVHKTESGTLLVGTRGGGLNVFDARNNKFEHYVNDATNPYSLSHNKVYSIGEDQSGRIWIGTSGGGLNLFDPVSKNFTRYENDPKNPSSLSDIRVFSICADQSGRIWIGTYERGLSFFDSKMKSFEWFRNNYLDPYSLVNNNVHSFCEDPSGGLWVGTDGGLDFYDEKLRRFEHFVYDPKNPFSLPNNNVQAVYVDSKGRLWATTFGGGLSLFDSRRKRFERFQNDPANPSSLSNNDVSRIYEDRFGSLWIGTFAGGINRFDPVTKKFEQFTHNPQDVSSLSNSTAVVSLEDHKGRLWIGTRSGLNLFEPKTKTFERFNNNPKDPFSVSNDDISVIYEDRLRRLWIGTGNGLNLFEVSTKRFRKFTEKDGLPNNFVYGILEDDHGSLWISTNKGLSKMTLPPDFKFESSNQVSFRNYDITDGLQSNEFNEGAFFRSRDGKMYFGGGSGFNVFHPDSIRDDDFVPPIRLTGFEIFNKPVEIGKDYEGFVLPTSITELDELILSYRESVFSIEFSALSYALSRKNKFAYKLEGFDKEWNYTDASRRFATYTHLDPGVYTFRVKGSNHDGVWNEKGRTLKITITPPWWSTWWAKVLYGALFIVAVSGIIRIRIQTAKRHAFELLRSQKEEANIKEAELRAQTAEAEARALRAEDERKQHELEKAEQLSSINVELQSAIKQLRETQVELVQKEKMASLGQMTAGIAHEINNPLTYIYGNLEYLKQGLNRMWQLANAAEKEGESKIMALQILGHEVRQLEKEMPGHLDTTLVGARRIKEIVENLRKFARVGESGAKSILVNEDLETILDLFVKQHAGIRIERHFSEAVLVSGNASELNQSYLNVLTNSIQAIRDAEKQGVLKFGEGIIDVSIGHKVHEKGNFAVIHISDNGIGIPDSNKNKIFDPFFTTREIGQGRGLGLAEAYGIVHKHGGTIEVSSNASRGTMFSITLPASE